MMLEYQMIYVFFIWEFSDKFSLFKYLTIASQDVQHMGQHTF